jgi:RNA-binding protein
LSRLVLAPRQRKYLRQQAHSLQPVVRLGRSGVSAAVIAETDRALESHELIKVKIEAEEGEQRKQMALSLADATGAEVAGLIGRIAILYRPRSDDPKILLPRV